MDPLSMAHNPGGKRKIKSGYKSEADISECGRYRTFLKRAWGPNDFDDPFLLWVGMNPSVADADYDDPTCRKEIDFTKRWGYTCYVKCNIMDARLTDSLQLRNLKFDLCRQENLDAIDYFSGHADKVILCTGNQKEPKAVKAFQDALAVLRKNKEVLYCMGTNKTGYPVHTLYLPSQSKLRVY